MDVIILNSGPNVLDGTLYRTLGAYKIARSARQAGYTAQVIDHVVYFTTDQIIKAVEKFITNETIVLGVSTTFLTPTVDGTLFTKEFIAALNYITLKYPNVNLIFGGTGTSALNTANLARIYGVILKYAEDAFVEVLNHLAKGTAEPEHSVNHLKKTGIPYKVYTEPLVERFNIETDDFTFHKDDVILHGEALPLEISRGCIFKCKFCNHLMLGRGKLDYLRSFDLVKQELLYNYENFGTTRYYIICDTFNDTEFKMKAWHSMVMSLPFKIQYTAYTRADLLDKFPDVPYLLHESGMLSTFHGIETFHEQASMYIGKGWSSKKGKEYLPKLYHDIWKKEVHQTLSFIVGLPGETREDVIESANWFVKNDMYNITWHSLGLSLQEDVTGIEKLLRHPSEFEKESAKFGYYFPLKEYRNTWHNDYWSVTKVNRFIADTIRPITDPHNATHGSWAVIQLLQLGYTEKDFLKENRKLWRRENTVVAKQKRLEDYIQRLMAK